MPALHTTQFWFCKTDVRLERVFATDSGMSAGYESASDAAKYHGLKKAILGESS